MTFRLTIDHLAAFGDAPALISRTESLSYSDLAKRASAASVALRDAGAVAGSKVALVSVGRGFEEAIMLCAILASGCVAVPLDASAPPQRLSSLVRGRGCNVLFHDESGTALASAIETASRTATSDPDGQQPIRRVAFGDNSEVAPSPETTIVEYGPEACILHTSGSTGTPKPVPVTWEGLDAFTGFLIDEIGLKSQDRVLRIAELVFDLAWFDHIATFRAGAALLCMTRRELAAGRALREAVYSLSPTVIYGVPSLFMKLGAAMGPGETLGPQLRTVMFAGEVFPPSELLAFAERAPAADLYNLYGPTETNVCTYHKVDRSALDGIRETPIGRECPYSPTWIVGEDGAIVEGPGEGELVVKGPTTLFGGPFPTRDRVLRGEDGLYYFRGRIDRMIKIRGYRVEPAEVEAALSRHPDVEQAAAKPVDDARLGRVLHAFVAKKQGSTVTDRDLRRFLSELLPPYMVPEKVLVLDELPRTTTGKIDYQALSP